MSFIPIISYPRTGSSYLINVLDKFDNITYLMEPFHPDEQVVYQHLKHRLGGLFEPFYYDVLLQFSSLNEFSRTEPVKFLLAIQTMLKAEYLTFKIFPEHLSSSKILEVISLSQAVIFNERNVLQSFISNEIASKSGVYAKIDTSAELISFEESRFLWWKNYTSSHLTSVKSQLVNITTSSFTIHYEDVIDEAKAFNKLKLALLSEGIKVSFSNEKKVYMKRQDSRLLPSEKVLNPKTMVNVMKKHNLSYLLDGGYVTSVI